MVDIHQKLKQLIEPNCTIIEIGSHIGTDTVKLCNNLKPQKLYAIEPDTRNIKEIINLRLSPNVNIINAAVGNKTGAQTFYESYGNTPRGRLHTDSNSLMKPIKTDKRPDWVKFKQSTVNVYRLDDLVKYVSEIDLIWMDVQGAELLVIEGATETLKRTKYLYTECQEGRYEGQPGLGRILAALPGWGLVERYNDNVLLKRVS